MANEETQKMSDLMYTSVLMKKFTNLQGMVRDLYHFAVCREKGINAEMMLTGNEYIDEIAEILRKNTDYKVSNL